MTTANTTMHNPCPYCAELRRRLVAADEAHRIVVQSLRRSLERAQAAEQAQKHRADLAETANHGLAGFRRRGGDWNE